MKYFLIFLVLLLSLVGCSGTTQSKPKSEMFSIQKQVSVDAIRFQEDGKKSAVILTLTKGCVVFVTAKEESSTLVERKRDVRTKEVAYHQSD